MGDKKKQDREGIVDTGTIPKKHTANRKPRLYKVLLLNDDYTPMDFVVHVLENFFNKPTEEAVEIMLAVHNSGAGVCGIYTHEIAETKVTQVVRFARRNEHPLQCRMERC
jgi:ATP-dependent Clp protease adaptor protein ClpS